MFISEIVALYNADPIAHSREFFYSNPTPVELGGRITAIRAQRTLFMTLSWGQTTIQLMCESTNLCRTVLDTLTVGSIIEVQGSLMRSMRGELSVVPSTVVVNSQSAHNLELNWDFNANPDALREVNLMRNRDLMAIMHTRSRITQRLRERMYAQNFLEIETPILHSCPSGAAARTFETHCLANAHNYHLRIAPEIYLVRTLMSGFNQIFEIGHNFRNEGISNRHQPEFTMLECYRAFSDYEWAMGFTEDLLRSLAVEFNCEILNQPFARHTYQEALVMYHPELRLRAEVEGEAAAQALITERDWLVGQLTLLNPSRDYSTTSLGMLQYQLFESVDNLIMNPTFITNHPVQISPLAHAIEGSEETERFELFVNGRELGNGFSQLIEPGEQRARFAQQSENHTDDAMRTDDIYLESMGYGFPRIGGFGIGIDRLVMLLTHQSDIRNVVLYPV